MDTAPAAEAECLSNNLGWLLGRAEHVLAAELGLALVEGRRTEHRTPSGTVQPFSWALLRRG